MSVSPEQPSDAMKSLLESSQVLAKQFLDFLGTQHSAFKENGFAVPPVGLPEGQQLVDLQRNFAEQHARLWQSMVAAKPGEKAEPVAEPPPGDRRFSAPEWSSAPYFDYVRQAYLLNASYLTKLAEAAPVSDGDAKARLQFVTRQYVEALAPSNFAATNPEFIKLALETNGESISRGIQNLLEDLRKGRISMTDDAAFEVGRNLALTPGAVIYENQLMQLIQYAPSTDTVASRPLLIVPPCINKFYIMDLQPENSLVKFAVDSGMTVFLVSWKNPKEPESKCTWDDYLALGPITALQIVRDVTGEPKPNVLGFCVGGTLLSSALAVLRGKGEDPVNSLTLMTTLLDFSDAGELGCMVDEASVAAREAAIGRGGLLSGKELAAVFSSLRANDLIWQYVVNNYLKGGKPPAFDLLYWNSDSTNLPGPFLAWYLRNMYLTNSLRVPGKLEMLGVKVDLGKVDVPAYLLATREDHIVPWESAYLVRQILGGATTFVLGASGHIAGAINPASKNKRSYWVNDADASNSGEWLAGAQEQKGSWWNHWREWLQGRSGDHVPARSQLGGGKYPLIEPAPGRYVKEKI